MFGKTLHDGHDLRYFLAILHLKRESSITTFAVATARTVNRSRGRFFRSLFQVRIFFCVSDADFFLIQKLLHKYFFFLSRKQILNKKSEEVGSDRGNKLEQRSRLPWLQPALRVHISTLRFTLSDSCRGARRNFSGKGPILSSTYFRQTRSEI